MVTLTVNILLNLILIPRLLIYGAVISIMVSDILQVLGAYFYSQKISPIRWNLAKLLYSPLICVALVIIFEITKETFGLNSYISASASVAVLIASLLILYRKDISRFLNRL
jgi:O-antigen/teichoic acid export membrane protein